MDPISEGHRPQYVRISFPKYTGEIPEIGHSIKTTAHVTPPQGPVEQGGFDFRRHAYFQSLGGVGYARKGFEPIDAPREQRFWKDRQRRLSNFIAEHMPDRSLGFAAHEFGPFAGDFGIAHGVTDDCGVWSAAYYLRRHSI